MHVITRSYFLALLGFSDLVKEIILRPLFHV
jgi:hypothetical protein